MTTRLSQPEPIDRIDILEHELATVNRTIAHFLLQREGIQERLDQALADARSARQAIPVQQAA